MCCRCFLRVGIKDIISYYFGTENYYPMIEYEPREIFPSDAMPVVHRGKERDRSMHLMNWGFAPSYMKNLVINARSETIMEKKMFKESFERRRCILPVSGYYEWEKIHNEEGKEEKIKREITMPNQEILSLAGIYDRFQGKDGQLFWAVTVLTKEADLSIAHVHDRMPVILSKELESEWLNTSHDQYESLLKKIKISHHDYKIK